MRRRVVLPGPLRGELRLEGAPFHHLVHVLRLGEGETLEALDGQGGRSLVRIVRLGRRHAQAEVLSALPPLARPASRLTLVHGLSRGQRTEWVLQKGVELGVDVLAPASCARSVPRAAAPDRRDRRHERWQEIVLNAAAQCGAPWLPQLCPLAPLEQALRERRHEEIKLLAHPGGAPLRSLIPALAPPPPTVCLAVGPEGGFTAQEVAEAACLGFAAVDLGPLVLRTETAALALTALLAFLLGRLEPGHDDGGQDDASTR